MNARRLAENDALEFCEDFRQLVIINEKRNRTLEIIFWDIDNNLSIVFSFFPATRSRTATLLRLHPNCQFFNKLNKVKSSSKTSSLHVTGGVYKAN